MKMIWKKISSINSETFTFELPNLFILVFRVTMEMCKFLCVSACICKTKKKKLSFTFILANFKWTIVRCDLLRN